MGHAIRSKVVIQHLIELGHQVEIIASGKATKYLRTEFEGVHPIHGLHMVAEDNKVSPGKTLWSNVKEGLTGLPKNIVAYFKLIEHFKPQLVISDFESWTYLYAKVHNLPILSIDNIQAIHRCSLPKGLTEGAKAEFEVTKNFIKGKLPGCDEYIVTSFADFDVRKERTKLVPPILRPTILDAPTSVQDHVLVYQTASGFSDLEERLQQCGLECRVYGAKKDLTSDLREKSLIHRPFSEKTFIEDLSSAKAVIGSAGFTLMGECVYLKKPMLALPLGGQFEQLFNARTLEHLGYGMVIEDSSQLDKFGAFLDDLATFESNLLSYSQNRNMDVFAALDEFIETAL